MQKKTFVAPEIVELGAAATLTQGAKGCRGDAQGCEFDSPADPF